MILDVGRVCIKIAGREAGSIAVVVDVVDSKHVRIDGNVKRKKCNILHLDPTDLVLKLKKNANHSSVITEMKKAKLEIKPSKTQKPQKERPRKQRKQKIKEEVKPETPKKETKKPSPKKKAEKPKKETKPKAKKPAQKKSKK